MKSAIVFFAILLPFIALCQESTLFIESNITYAPIGIKFMHRNDVSKTGFFVAARISEDYLTREVAKGSAGKYEEGDLFDVNESIISFGTYYRFLNNIDFYFGFGILGGRKFKIGYDDSENKTWTKYTGMNSIGMSPLISYGFIFDLEDIRVSFGYDIAFSSKNSYPEALLNDRSFLRLTGITIGIGYILNR
ncbi:MAG: hypothetical protein RBS73_06445 [Prolixibacteraceae bacterium]|jgi:hypothetical protein|nr:hypothetical protein [Prolixibacteraceae bacterium]